MSKSFAVGVCLFAGAAGAWGGPPVGWRGDGTGRYPKADPPTAWSADENIAWKTELPGPGYGSPIVVGERVFVTAEPGDLLCLDAATGRILWKRTHTFSDVFGPSKGAEITEKLERAKKYEAMARDVRRQASQLKRAGSLTDEKKRELDARHKELRRKARDVTEYPVARGRSYPGSRATPASDGELVYAVTGNGVASCHTLAGERKWMKFMGGSPLGFGHAASPLLIRKELIVHIDDMVGLDPGTGNELWRTKVRPSFGSPVAATVGGRPLVVSPAGAVVDPATGKILADKLFRLGTSSPTVHENVIYTADRGKSQARAVKLTADGDGVKAEALWEARASRDTRFASPVYHDGLVYIMAKNILTALDAKTGKAAYRERLPVSGNSYPSPAVAGGRLYVGAERGAVAVVAPGREFAELSVNRLGRLGSCPAFAGRRMYLRTVDHLVCIGE